MTEIDADLIARAAGGERAAFEEIYKRTSAYVYSVVYRMLHNHADTSEAVQDVYMKVYRNLGRFKKQAQLKTWIYRIAVNTSLNYLKKRKSERLTQNDSEAEPEAQGSSAPEAGKEMMRAESETLLQSYLALLNPDQRACIILREIEGLDYQSIADTLGINLNTVRTRLKRARENLMQFAKKGVVR